MRICRQFRRLSTVLASRPDFCLKLVLVPIGYRNYSAAGYIFGCFLM
jgi:hypothetical protein